MPRNQTNRKTYNSNNKKRNMYIHCEFTPTSQPVNPVQQDVGTSQTTQLFLSSGKTVVN